MESGPRAGERRDYSAITGIAVGAAVAAGGFLLERGQIGDLASLRSAALVVGGTIGAVLVGTPFSALSSAWRRCRNLFRTESCTSGAAAVHIERFAALARRLGVASIEEETEALEDGFLRHALLLVIDGVAPHEVRRQLEIDIASGEERAEADARVFEQAGGYAPTIGIIGAVIGLIQVMKQSGNGIEVGHGIASAFTSTLYGVALANLLLLPIAARIRSRARSDANTKELILEGVTAMSEGLSLHIIRTRVKTFLNREDALPLNPAVSTLPAPSAARKSA
jgi:chemotaxis protein MotA